MTKRYYIKATRHHPHSNKHQNLLQYVFVSANSIVVVLLLLLFNPLPVVRSYVSPVTEEQQSTSSSERGEPSVQGVSVSTLEETTPTLTTVPSPALQPTITSTPTPTPPATKKKSYRIAVYGDSMVDTMGELAEYLEHSLKRKYPKTDFALFNYGMGSQNAEEGLARFHSGFSYQTRNYSPIADIKADIIIMGSFAYNPFTPHNRDRHWLALTSLVQEAQRTGAQVYLLAEIAPLREDFGTGPNGVNWSRDASYIQSQRIIEQLENAVGLSTTLHVPLINVFEASFQERTRKVIRKYVNPSDGIHPSVEGHEFTADLIADSLQL